MRFFPALFSLLLSISKIAFIFILISVSLFLPDIVIDTVSVPVTVNIAVTFDTSSDSVAFSVHETDCL